MSSNDTTTAAPPAFVPNPNAPLTGTAAHISEAGLKAVVWSCFVVASAFVGLRLTVRFRQNGRLLADDCWIVFAWCCVATMATIQTLQMPALWYITYLTAGRLMPGEELAHYGTELVRWQFPIIKLFWTTLWSVKASFLAVFYRLVKPFPVLRRLWYCVAVFTTLAYIGCWLASTLTCSPPSDYFVYGKCNSPHEVWMQTFNVLYSTTVDIVSDVMIMALPITVLPSLQLNKRRKAGLAVAFSLGLIIIAVAAVRMTQVISGRFVDLVGLATWGAVETATALIVGSLPPLKSLLSRSMRKYATGRSGGRATGAGITPKGNKNYGPASTNRTVVMAGSIPLDDVHRSEHKDGGIYVQRTYDTHLENDGTSSRDDDEAEMVKGSGRGKRMSGLGV